MSIEEMKATAIEKIIALEDQEELEDVLKYLSHLPSHSPKYDLAIHYKNIKEKHGDVLLCLAK